MTKEKMLSDLFLTTSVPVVKVKATMIPVPLMQCYRTSEPLASLCVKEISLCIWVLTIGLLDPI